MKRKILFLVHRLHIGGAPKSAITWYNFLKKKNFDIKIVSFERVIKIDYKGEIISLDVPPTNNIFLKPIILLKRILMFKKLLKREDPEYVISFMEGPNIINLLTFHSRPILTVHGILSQKFQNTHFVIRFIYSVLIRFLYGKAFLILAVSQGVKRDLVENFKLAEEKIKVWYNPIDSKEILKLSKQKVKIDAKDFILTIGRLVEDKDTILLVKAYNLLSEKIKKKYSLMIIGDGEKRKEIEEYIIKNQLTEKVILKGFVKNPYPYLAKASLFVLPSKSEAFGIVIPEAMLLNVPVITYYIPFGGTSEIICSKEKKEIIRGAYLCKYGILLTDRNPELLAKVIEWVFSNKLIIKRLQKAGLKRAKEFDINYLGDKFLKIIQ